MKKLRLFLGCCAVLCCAAIQASVQVGDLYYDLDSSAKTATLVKSDTYKSLTSLSVSGTIASGGVNYAVTSIGDSAFYGCSNLTAVNIPSSVLKVGNFAFFKCSGLTTLNVASKITGTCSFACCTSITTITIASTVTCIGNGAFYGDSLLTSITIPANVTSIGTNPFTFIPNLKSILVDAQNPNYSSDNGVLYSKDKSALIAYPYAASGEITILPSVKNIEDFALQGNPNLKSLTLPSSVTSIGNWAFEECTNLTSVNIPANVTSIGDGAFQNCPKLTSVDVPSSVTNIGSHAFQSCSGLTSVSIPSNVTNLGDFAFFKCSGLTTLNVASTIIGASSFAHCTSLTTISIASTVNSIGDGAFYCDSLLTSVTIPANVTYIGTNPFTYSPNLKSIFVDAQNPYYSSENGVLYTKDKSSLIAYPYAVSGEITILPSVTFIAYFALQGNPNLKSLTIPSSVKNIGNWAFEDCPNLTSINIPASVTNIGDHAFQFCPNLTSVNIPASVTNIGGYAFHDCSNLKKVCCFGSVPTTGTDVFSGNDQSKDTLCVDAAYLEAYRESVPWKNFGTIRLLTNEERSIFNTLSINDTIAYKGVQLKLPILMTNRDSITAFQCDIYLPAGVTIAKQDGDYLIDLGERTTLKKHTLSSALQSDGAIRVVVYSSTSTAFTGTSGAALYLTLDIADTVAAGDYQIQIKNMTLSTVDAKAYSPASVSSRLTLKDYRLGDVDNSGIVNINDAVAIVNKLLGKSSTSFLAKAADVDKDGNITINDVVMLINKYILNLSTSSAKARYAGTAAHNMATLDAEPININAGEEHTMNIALNNSYDAITAFQFDVNLPKGFSIVKDADGNYSQLAEGRSMSATHQLGSNMLQNGDLRVACFSANNAVIAGQSGAVAAIRIKADANVPNGTYYLTLHNAVLAHPDGMNSIAPAEQRIAINVGTTGIENAENSGLQITAGKGIITLQTSNMQAVQITAINGMRIATFTLQAGESRTLTVAAGLYIVNGKKVVVE